MFRLVILYRYGGVYTDLDFLYVNNIEPLLGLEFVTEFSSSGDVNCAIMRLFARSSTATAFHQLALQQKPRLRMWTYGPWLIDRVKRSGHLIHALPWCFFHGIWGAGAIPRDALVGASSWSRAQLDNVFGLHLHGAGKGGGRISPSSVVAVTAQASKAKLAALKKKA